MPDTDAPQVEPLTLTLEEALVRLYAKGLTLIPPGDDTDSWGIGVASDSPDEEFDTWHEAVSAVEGVPVVPRDTADLTTAYMVGFEKGKDAARDDTAALVAAVESGLHYIKWAEEHGHMGAPSSRTLIETALARVRSELGEGWDEPYAHRDPGNARPARTARKAKGES